MTRRASVNTSGRHREHQEVTSDIIVVVGSGGEQNSKKGNKRKWRTFLGKCVYLMRAKRVGNAKKSNFSGKI
jgi:hypothetical protein